MFTVPIIRVKTKGLGNTKIMLLTHDESALITTHNAKDIIVQKRMSTFLNGYGK